MTAAETMAKAAGLLGGQRELARLLNVTERSVRYWIAGDREPSAGVLVDLAVVLALRSDDLLELSLTLGKTLNAELDQYGDA